jgi:hypothetical protein
MIDLVLHYTQSRWHEEMRVMWSDTCFTYLILHPISPKKLYPRNEYDKASLQLGARRTARLGKPSHP